MALGQEEGLSDEPLDAIIQALQERAKELDCLYRVDEILNQRDSSTEELMRRLVETLPRGWRYPDRCVARILLEGRAYETPGFRESPWMLRAPIVLEGAEVGEVAVCYTHQEPAAAEGPFLHQERRLINAIGERIGQALLRNLLRRLRSASQQRLSNGMATGRWAIILDFLRRSDRALLVKLTRRMINHLGWKGVPGAKVLLHELAPPADQGTSDEGHNRPLARATFQDLLAFAERTFRLSSADLGEEELLSCILLWIKEDRASFLYSALEDQETSLPEIAALLERFHALDLSIGELPVSMQTGLRAGLLSRFFRNDLDFINMAKQLVEVDDFHALAQHTIFPKDSHGKLGGKAAGLFVATRAIEQSREYHEILSKVKIPRTWYLASDALLHFIRYNSLDEVYDRKYCPLEQIRQEYPYLVQVFKASSFPPDLVKALCGTIDDLGDRPIIVRSSSLLEDRVGSAFSGKYKSLFLANQGDKATRLAALQEAIAEIYASVFGPDPIEYRAERGLLDVHEEMGILIQEVVGCRIGRYFLPAYSGVAYSHNELRWSSRIRREDGLVRLVPGLGTRAVDRLADDYPVLVAPGQPKLRVNTTPDEVVRYSPQRIDVIDLESGRFDTVEIADLLRHHGAELPRVRRIVSVLEQGMLRKPMSAQLDFRRDELVVTFEGLIADTGFVTRIRTLLQLLQERMGFAVDLEFASDGEHFYLLQCRAQGRSSESAPSPIPRDLPADVILFSANRFVSNGRVPELTHAVYVDDEAYTDLPEARDMRRVGEAVGRLNMILPKRQFILMGPGRWGSRGDIRLGVGVTYSQINNTAMLVEIARQRGQYLPDVSFGTHFFQDLVEAGIRYLPLFPDDPEVVFNEPFFRRSKNLLPELLPGFADLAEVVRVIDVRQAAEGKILRVLLNAELERAIGLLTEPGIASETDLQIPDQHPLVEPRKEDHWRWRLRMAERIAASIDPARFGIQGIYVFGSTKNTTAGPGSDLDLIVHVRGSEQQEHQLRLWLEGWSLSLAEMNYLRTGYQSSGLLDVHLVRDEDIARRTSFAAKIGAVTDAARPLPLGQAKAAG